MLTLRIRQLSLHGLDALPMLTIPDEERQLVLFGERLSAPQSLGIGAIAGGIALVFTT